MSHASVAAAARGSSEMFDDVLRLQSQLEADFALHEDRQARFKKQFARETRRHHSAISSLACVANSTPSSNAVLYAPSTQAVSDPSELEQPATAARRRSMVSRQLERLKHPDAQSLRDKLACFYLPPVVTTDIVCDMCGAFKSIGLVTPLPEPWQEFQCEDTRKRYFYNAQTKQVLWSPPAETSPFAVFVFERTHSVSTVCHCIPSHERRKRCMHKFRQYASDAAKEETEKRNRKIHGAFKTLAHAVIKSTAPTGPPA